MAEFVPASMYIQWSAGASGTVNLQADYRTFTYTPSIDVLDSTAGTDTSKGKIAGLKDGIAAIGWLDQQGTANNTALNEGVMGTLVWGPEGTAAGKPKYTMPGMAKGITRSYGYNALVECSVDIEQVGNRTDGTY